jgi:hypothetical protein
LLCLSIFQCNRAISSFTDFFYPKKEKWIDGFSERAIEFSLKSSCLHLVFGPLFTPLPPLWEWGLESKEVLLNLGMKCWNLTRFLDQTQGSGAVFSSLYGKL